jgi:hypothetical protein
MRTSLALVERRLDEDLQLPEVFRGALGLDVKTDAAGFCDDAASLGDGFGLPTKRCPTNDGKKEAGQPACQGSARAQTVSA